MPESSQLSVNDRVLLHLSRFAADIQPNEYSAETTQAGIAAAVGISRTHVPRAVDSLTKAGLLEEIRGRVAGHERRMSVYVITPEGLRCAEMIWNRLLDLEFTARTSSGVSSIKGRTLEEMLGKKRAMAIVSQMKNGVIELEERRRPRVRAMEGAPEIKEFFGREKELADLKSFIESKSKVAVVLGNHGYGTTALVRMFVEDVEDKDVLWVPVSSHTTVADIQGRLLGFAKQIAPSAQSVNDALSHKDSILVFDGYHAVREEVVEFFSEMVEKIGDGKVIVTAREEMPAYNWFYRKKQVDQGIVTVLRVRGLDDASAMKLLGNENIERDALRRIMMMTRGQPLALRLLREGEMERLKKETTFSAEEVRYLLFLKDKNQ